MSNTGETTETDENIRDKQNGSETETDEELSKREVQRGLQLLEIKQKRSDRYVAKLRKHGFCPSGMVLRKGFNTPQSQYIRDRVQMGTDTTLQDTVGQFYFNRGKMKPYRPTDLLYDIRRSYYKDPRQFYLAPHHDETDLVAAYEWFIDLPEDKACTASLDVYLLFLQHGQKTQWITYLQVCQGIGIFPIRHPKGIRVETA